MRIAADKNILAIEKRFRHYGDLRLFDGRSLRREDLLDVDALLVRSITPVNAELLRGTQVSFVGTATSGTDHVDTEFLDSSGIHFVDAKGSNANAVVDYCFAALAYAVLHRDFSLEGVSVGIVGAGAVGGLLASRFEALGFKVRCCDPPLAASGKGSRSYCSLSEALACEIVSLHVPLNPAGAYPTLGLIGSAELAQLRPGALLINACRGSVVDETALKTRLGQGANLITVFDVWDGEPDIDEGILRAVDIATPHIAGYSQEAKLRATEILALALEGHFDHETPEELGSPLHRLTFSAAGGREQGALEWQTLLDTFPLDTLSREFIEAFSRGEAGEVFDAFRQRLRQRRESSSIQLPGRPYSVAQKEFLSVLGFTFE